MIPDNVLLAARILVNREPQAEIPKACRTLREHGNLSQPELAQRLHLGRSSISNWESGQNLIPPNKTLYFFRTIGFSEELINSLVKIDRLPVLDHPRYLHRDPDYADYEFFQQNHPQFLETVRNAWLNNDMTAAKLWSELRKENLAKIGARESKAISTSVDGRSLRNQALTSIKLVATDARSSGADAQTATDETTTGSSRGIDNNASVCNPLETQEAKKT